MDEVWKEFLTGSMPGIIIAALTGGVPALLAWRKLKATLPMDNAAKLSTEALKIVETYRKEVQDLKRELHDVRDEFEDKNDKLEKKVSVQTGRITRLSGVVRDLYNGSLLLVKQIEENGLVPVWIPPVSADQLISDIRNGD